MKPSDLSIAQSIALDGLYNYIMEQKELQKRKFVLLDKSFHEKYQEILKDESLHTEVLKSSKDQDLEENEIEYEKEMTFN